ncbi:MAG: EF-P lysine aminoacylase EpmA [Methylococcales bacterium]|nr:EF-P lysine aminoacylase EpmA [Methylococcales bacterium]
MPNTWQPTCSIELMRLRAQMLYAIRQFFLERDVLEVETPLLSHSSGTDPQLDFFTTEYGLSPLQRSLFLQTSPEFAMKRLLAAGSGSIYQIGKAFRNGESGRFHNPEFTLLEWYRVGFTLPQLMDEIAELIDLLFKNHRTLNTAQRFSYRELFLQHTGLDPLVFSNQDYCAYALDNDAPEAVSICGNNHALWLDFIFSHKVQPRLKGNVLYSVYDYPACQSSLARINADSPLVTDRVEIFIDGIELGNGYYELTDAKEQEKRFDDEIGIRLQEKRPFTVKDKRLIAALEAGLPDCSGMAIGLDRLLMLLSDSATIQDVLNFPIHRA